MRQPSSGKGNQDKSAISDFNGHYQFLNNDHPAWVLYDNMLYPSASIAYQASRTSDLKVRSQLQEVETFDQFKEISMTIPNPSNWNAKKMKVMEKIVRDKFKRSKELGQRLAATHPRNLVNGYKEGNQGEIEQYWGVIHDGRGSNTLGKILMNVREEYIKGTDCEKWVNDQGVQNNPKKWPTLELTVLKDDKPIDKLFLEKKSKFYFGALPTCEYKLDHPSISKVHACIFFGEDSAVFLVDLGSSNGTTLIRGEDKTKIEALRAVILQNKDVVVFGLSSRKYRVEIKPVQGDIK